MLVLHAGIRVRLALGATDMRKGFDELAAQLQTALKADPFSGHLFLFRGKRGDLLKALWWDGQGLVLLAKRLEKGRSIWPTVARRLAKWRKNYLFEGSLEGGRRAAIIYTLVGTAAMNGRDPQAYLRVVRYRIADHPINCICDLARWSLWPDVA